MCDVQPIWKIAEFCGFCTDQGCTAWDPPQECRAAHCLYGRALRPDVDEADRAFVEAHGPHFRGIPGPRGEWVRLNDAESFEETAFCNAAFDDVITAYLFNHPFESAAVVLGGYKFEVRARDADARLPFTPEDAAMVLLEAVGREPALAGANVEVVAKRVRRMLVITLALPRSLAVEQQVPALARAVVGVLKKHYPSTLEPWFFTFEELVESGWSARLSQEAWEVFYPNGESWGYIGSRDRRNRPLKFPAQALKLFHELQVMKAYNQRQPVPEEVRKEVRPA